MMVFCKDSKLDMQSCKLHKESSMHFCPLFNSENINSFYIEKEELYEKIKSGTRVVEFISLKGRDLFFIEAKESAPKKTKIKKPSKIYKEPYPYNETNLDINFQNWSSDDFEQWTKWKIKQDKLESYFQELYDKMSHSLSLISAKELNLQKHINHDIPDGIKGQLAQKEIIFLLIIKNKDITKRVDYAGILDKLEKKFIPLKQIWDIKIRIYDNEQAKKKGFIA